MLIDFTVFVSPQMVTSKPQIILVNCCGIMVLVDESSDQKTHITLFF